MDPSTDHIKMMAVKMKEIFEKHREVIHGMMAIANILNLRYKMKLIGYYFPLIYGASAFQEIERICAIFLDLVNEIILNMDEVHNLKDI